MKKKWNALAMSMGLLLATTLGSASAVELRKVQYDKSAVNFSYKQMGVAMDGKFKKFAADLAFDPAKPQSARAKLDVDLASVDAGSSDADDEVVGREWFNAKSFPKATFVSSAIKPLGSNRYEVVGKLSIKGQSRDISFPATFSPTGKGGANGGVFDGAFTIRRGDFAIGEGAWSKFDIVANDVQVKFRITAAP